MKRAFIFYLQAILCTNNPSSHWLISETEKNYLTRELGELKRHTDLSTVPWRAIVTSVPVYAIVIAQMGHTWGLFVVLTDLQKYLKDVFNFDIKKNGMLTSLPWLLMWICCVTMGFVADYLIKNKYLGVTVSRKLYTAISGIGPGIFLALVAIVGCDQVLVVVMFTLGMGFMGPFFSGVKPNCVDIAPNFAGIIMAIANGFGGLMGILVPIVIGFLAPNASLSYSKHLRSELIKLYFGSLRWTNGKSFFGCHSVC